MLNYYQKEDGRIKEATTVILYIVRHGQSERNLDESCLHDCKLTRVGVDQAHAAAKWLAGKGVDELFTSPAIRALQTSQIISGYLGTRPRVLVDIIEQGFLEDEPGLTCSEVLQRFEGVRIDDLPDSSVGLASHTAGESFDEVWERAQRIRDGLLTEYGDRDLTLCLVTHYAFSNCLLGSLLEVDMSKGTTGFVHENCGITCIESRDGHRFLHFANSCGHLEEKR